MVGVISANGLGVSLSSWASLGGRGLLGQAQQGQTRESVLVNAATGNLVIQDQDANLVSRLGDIQLLRTYNSKGAYDDDNADNWSLSAFSRSVRLEGGLNQSGSRLIKVERDGAESIYDYRQDLGRYVSKDGEGAFDVINYDASKSEYVWLDGDSGRSERFSGATGRLSKTVDLHGNSVTLSYNGLGLLESLQSSSGEFVKLEYVGNRLQNVKTQVIDAAVVGGLVSTLTSYAYHPDGRLAGVTVALPPDANGDPQIYETQYDYDESGRVSYLWQSDGTDLTISYQGERVYQILDGLGRTTTFAYNEASRTTTVSDDKGASTLLTYDSQGRLLEVSEPGARPGKPTWRYEYNSDGDLKSVRDALDHEQRFSYDDGRLVESIDTAGVSTSSAYVDNRLVKQSRQTFGGQTEANFWVYDATGKGELRFEISAEGRVTENRYNSVGRLTSSRTYLQGTFNAGNAASVSESSMLAWVAGQPKDKVLLTEYKYDLRGSLERRIAYNTVDATGAGVATDRSITQYVYDAAGRLVKTIDPASKSTSMVYDLLGRLIATTDANQVKTTINYQLSGDWYAVNTCYSNGLIVSQYYDKAGQHVGESRCTADIDFDATGYQYDKQGRLRRVSSNNTPHFYFYDEAGRVTAEVNAAGSVTVHEYNAAGQLWHSRALAETVDISRLRYLDVDDLVLSLDDLVYKDDDIESWIVYDSAGRAALQIDDAGRVVEQVFDHAGRAIEQRRYVHVVDVSTLTETTSLSTIHPPYSSDDIRQRQAYSADGQLVVSVDAEGFVTRFSYDRAGRLSSQTRFATALSDSQWSSMDAQQWQPITSDDDQTTRYVYDGKSQLIAELDAEGYLTERTYFSTGSLRQEIRYATRVGVADLSAPLETWRPLANVNDRKRQLTYDATGRLIKEAATGGLVTKYVYDDVGRLIQTERAAGTADNRVLQVQYDAAGRVVRELSAEGYSRLYVRDPQDGPLTEEELAYNEVIWRQFSISYGYDQSGRRITTTDPLGHTSYSFYDEAGAVALTINAEGEIRESLHDGLGRVVEERALATRLGAAELDELKNVWMYSNGRVPSDLREFVEANRQADLDGVVSYHYDEHGQLGSRKTAEGRETDFGYDQFGRMSRQTQVGSDLTADRSTHYTFDRRGLAIETSEDSSADMPHLVATSHYDAFGRVFESFDTGNRRSAWSYDKLGRVVSTKDAAHIDRRTEYDAFSRTVKQFDAFDHATTFEYDDASRTVVMTTPEGVQVTTTRNRHGEVVSVIDGRENKTVYGYDKDGRLESTRDAAGGGVTYHFNNGGQLSFETDTLGRMTRYTYDDAGRMLTRTVDPNGLALKTTYTYDAQSRRATIEDPSGTIRELHYDRDGLLKREVVDPAGLNLITRYDYDELGQLRFVTGPNDVVTEYQFDGLGRRTEEIRDPGGLALRTSYRYMPDGRLAYSIDALGRVTRFALDDLGREVARLDGEGRLTLNGYDLEGHLVRIETLAAALTGEGLHDTSGALDMAAVRERASELLSVQDKLELRRYDRDGRLVAKIDGTGAVIRYELDANGNVSVERRFATRLASNLGNGLREADINSLVLPANDDARDLVVRQFFDKANRRTLSVDGAGGVHLWVYDKTGLLTRETGYAKTLPADTVLTETGIRAALETSAGDQQTSWFYDAAGRTTGMVDGAGAVTLFERDGNGNVVKKTQRAATIGRNADASTSIASDQDRISLYAYDKTGREVRCLESDGALKDFSYDAAGNLVRTTAYSRRLGSVTLASVRSGESELADIAPDTDGAHDRTTGFAYDAAGRLVVQVDASGAITGFEYDAVGRIRAKTAFARLVTSGAVPQTVQAVAKTTWDRRTEYVDKLLFITKDDQQLLQRVSYMRGADGRLDQLQVLDSFGRAGLLVNLDEQTAGLDDESLEALLSDLLSQASPAEEISGLGDHVRVREQAFDAAGQLRMVTELSDGSRESFEYDGVGNRVRYTNANGAIWDYGYDGAGRLVEEKSPEILVYGSSVGPGGIVQLDAAATKQRVTTSQRYDGLGRLIERTEAALTPQARTTSYEYDAQGHQRKIRFGSAKVYSESKAALLSNGAAGEAARAEVDRDLFSLTLYNAFGEAVANRDVAGNWAYKTYDLAGRVSYEVDNERFVSARAYNAFGERPNCAASRSASLGCRSVCPLLLQRRRLPRLTA